MTARQPIPNAALDDRLGILGMTGSGKTYGAGTFVERILAHKGRVIIPDPLGVWWGLRLLADGKRPSRYDVVTSGDGNLSGPQQRIVDAIAWWNAAGIAGPSRTQVAFVARYKPNTGTFNTYVGSLNSAGLIRSPSPGRVALTETGARLANRPSAQPTADELHGRVAEILSGPQRKLLEPLLRKYPDSVSRRELAETAGYAPDIRVSIAGFNARKPLREDYDWMAKRYDVWRNQPTTILIGSSRVKQSIDPRLLAKTEFGPAYNAGMNGSAIFLETKAYVQDYLRADQNLQYLFIEAFTTALLLPPETARPSITPTEVTTRPIVLGFGFASDLAELTSVFLSFGGVTSAIRTIAANWGQRGLSPESYDGFAPIELAPHHFSVRNVFNFVLHTGLIARGTQLSPPMMAAAKQMAAGCERHQVECRFFLSPLHADVLYAMYYLGLWPELEKLKRGLAQLAPTYDFTRYSPVIDERIGPVLYWPEAFHFSPALGEMMTRAMTGLRTSDMPENFGTLLEPGNVDASLAAWREERDSWIAQHPDVVERMRKADENFRAGVSFQTVTDAEIAAGGW